jgi:hypothetical protein
MSDRPTIRFKNLSSKYVVTTSQIFLGSCLALTLIACGDSPSSDTAPPPTPTPAPVLSVSTAQGIWRSAAGAASTLSAVVLPDGKLWAVVSNTSGIRLIKAAVDVQNNSLVGTGKSFTLGTSTTSALSLSVSVVEKSSLNGVFSSADVNEPYSLAYQSRYDTPASLAEFAGAWQATLGPGTVNWTIGSTGSLTGTRTTGCTYTGQLSVRVDQKALLDAAITETCAGAVTQLNGVALKTEDKQGISLLMTTADESAAVAVTLISRK